MSHDTRFWHPFSMMGAVRGAECVIERGEDVWVYDTEGRRYLDATAALWYCNVGHGRKEIADAVADQMARLEAYSCFGDYANPPALALAERLAELAPVDDARVFLGSGGGDGIDTAAKIARRYFAETGEPERTHVIGREAAYHGTHAYGTSIGGIPANRQGFGELVADTSVVDRDDPEALRAEIDRVGADRVAAFFAEPVIGAGGVYPPAPGYLEACAEICREAGAFFVADCVICGFGRLGGWTGVERFGLRPDMIVFAKGVTSGYLPLGGVIASGRVAEPFWEGETPMLRHGATYGGHPTCCAAALANLDILESEGLIPRGAELEQPLLDALAPLADHPLVSEVRGGTGFMAAVGLVDGVSPVEFAQRSREESGVILRSLGTACAVSPPLTATEEHLDLIAGAFRATLDSMQPVAR
jgi:adenosylmethionine-8-amino-7-oxononanoate aminotransferase